MRWKDEPWIIADVETSGLDAAGDRVIEIGFCRVEERRVTERAGWLVDPELPSLPPAIVELTGLRIEDLRGQPRFAEIAPEVVARLGSAPVVVAYNAGFDRGFIGAELRRAGHALDGRPWADPLVYVREFDKYERGKKLTDATSRRKITVEGNAHRASADAELAGRLLLALLDRLPDDWEELIALQGRWQAAQEADMAAYRKRTGRASSPPPAAVAPSRPAEALAAGPATLEVWTAPSGRGDPDELDVTRRTGGPGDPFAPSDTLRHAPAAPPVFEAAYLAEMRQSWKLDRRAWDALLARRRVVLVCGCDDGARCHRRVLAEKILVKLGARYAGERDA